MNQVISNFSQHLAQDPENWDIRAHLAELMETEGDARGAAQLIMQAPVLPSDIAHLNTVVRILTPINPGAALPYVQMLKAAAMQAVTATQAMPAIAAAPPSEAPRTEPLRGNGRPAAPPAVQATSAPVHSAAVPAHAEEEESNHPLPPAYAAVPIATHVEFEKRKQSHSFGAGRLAVAIAIHGILLLAAGAWVIAKIVTKKKEELTFDAAPPRTSAVKGNEREVKLAKKKTSSAPAAARRIVSTAQSKISIPVIESHSTITDSSLNSMASFGGMGAGLGMGGVGGNGLGGGGMGGGGKGPFIGALNMDSRCSKGDREKRIRESGGDPMTEQRIAKSLEWFKANQNPDGSWGKTHKASMTGLALLAYLGHCETPDSSQAYGETVTKGIMFLVELLQKNSQKHDDDPKLVRLSTAGPESGPAAYEHGIAIYALSEAYSMTRYGRKRMPGLRDAVMQGVDIIIKGQDSDGGWNYGYRTKEDVNKEIPTATNSDLSVAGWQIQALNAARHTGLNFPGGEQCWKKVSSYLKAMQASNGTFGYRNPGGRWALTGVGGLCLVVAGDGRSGEMRRAVSYLEDQLKAIDKRDSLKRADAALEAAIKRVSQLEDNLRRANNDEKPKIKEDLTRAEENVERLKKAVSQTKAFVKGGKPAADEPAQPTQQLDWFRILNANPGGEMGLYGQYYVNQVAFMKGGNFWRQWNGWIQSDIFPAQSSDGSFPLEGGGGEGAHGSGGAGVDSNFYRTALATLMMEVYYRYLPATDKRVLD